MEVISEKVPTPAVSEFRETRAGELQGESWQPVRGSEGSVSGFCSGKSTVGVLRLGIHVAWNYFFKKSFFWGGCA